MKAINIRNYSGKPENRKSMGLQKAIGYKLGQTQEETQRMIMSFFYKHKKEAIKELLKGSKNYKLKEFKGGI